MEKHVSNINKSSGAMRSRMAGKKCKTQDLNGNICTEVNTYESCPICFEDFVNQDIGFPECCNHRYCFECLFDWSMRNKSCPIDRMKFNRIITKNPEVMFNMNCSLSDQTTDDTANTEINRTPDEICEVCRENEQQQHRFVFCSNCSNAYHLQCLMPALLEAPQHSWLCPTCEPQPEPTESSYTNVIPMRRRSARLLARQLNESASAQHRQRAAASTPRLRKRRSEPRS